MNCSGFEEMLRDDDRDLSDQMRTHADQCTSCRGLLDDWISISREASALVAPPPRQGFRSDVLQAVSRELAVLERRRTLHRQLLAVAAAVVMTLGMALVWSQMHPPADPLDEWVIRNRALEEVERSEAAYRQSIERLASAIDETGPETSSPRLAALQEKLLLIDQAIAECEASVEENPYHAGLRNQLLTVYRQKDETLREVLEARQQ